MKAMQVYISEDQHKALKIIYAETGQRMTESVRKAIDDYIKKNKKRNMGADQRV